jgi:hypothetical protein
MNAKTVFTCALVVILAGVPAVHGQSPAGAGDGAPVAFGGIPVATPGGAGEPLPEMQMPVLSSWILNPRGDVRGPVGGNGPIRIEFFLRSGIDFPVGGSRYMETLQNGWTIAGGIRSLFFTTAGDSAWAFDVGVLNTFNHGKRPDIQFPLTILVPPSTNNVIGGNANKVVNFGTDPGVPGVTTEGLNRTYFTLGMGKEWFGKLAFLPQCWNWRCGVDGGGRYGCESMGFNEIRHRTDTIGALYAAIHSDIEMPCNCAMLFVGLRLEYAYTWADILQSTTNADVQDLNLLFNVGLRY